MTENVNCEQLRLGFELGSAYPLPTTIIVTISAPPVSNIYSELCKDNFFLHVYKAIRHETEHFYVNIIAQR